MDITDHASEQEDSERAAVQAFRQFVPKPTGFCLNCGEPLQPTDCFCQPEADGDGCARDWDRARAARLRNGT